VSQEEKKGRGKKKATFTTGATKLLGYVLVVMFLLVWVFILGVLTGRGDVNRLFQRLGLYKTDLAARLGVEPDKSVTAALPLPEPEEANKALTDIAKKPAQEAETAEKPQAVASPAGKATEHAASIIPADHAKKPGVVSHDAKKSKGSAQQKHEPDHNRSLASKLSFQNSLDTTTKKQPKTVAKKEAAVHTAAITPQLSHTPAAQAAGDEKKKAACAYQIKVASYRTSEEAEKTMADLKKKGFNVSLQKGKDKSGATYIIKTGRYSNKLEAEKITKKLKEAQLNGQIQEIKQ